MDKMREYVEQNGKPAECNRHRDGKRWPRSAKILFWIFLTLMAAVLFIVWIGHSLEPNRQPLVEKDQRDQYATENDWLEPRIRFEEYQSGDQYYDAQQALNKGDVLAAIKLFGSRNSIINPDSAREKRMTAAIQKASDEQMNIDPAEDFSYRAREYWLPELQEIVVQPILPENISVVIGKLEEAQRRLDDVQGVEFSEDREKSLNEYISKLREAQAATFPKMRDAIADDLRTRLFRRNIDVAIAGSNNDHLVFTGVTYLNYATIEKDFAAIKGQTERTRFKKVTFRSSSSAQSYSYLMSTPSDKSVNLPND